MHWVKHLEQWGLFMQYKGCKYIQFLSIGSYLGGATTVSGSSYTDTMQRKSALLNARNAANANTIAASTASLSNQAGGNIGFTYE